MTVNPRSIANLAPWTPATAPRAGRPPGARDRLSKRFLRDLDAAWEADGKVALLRLVEQDPAQFIALVAAIATRTRPEADAPTGKHERIANALERLAELADKRARRLPTASSVET